MKTAALSVLWIWIGFGQGALAGGWGAAASKTYVLEVIQVHSLGEFTCRVDEWKQIPNLKLRVEVRGLEWAADDPNARKVFEELLFKSGSEIILKNVEDKGYFRVAADVYAGNQNMAEMISSRVFLLPKKTEEESREPAGWEYREKVWKTAEVRQTLPKRLNNLKIEEILSQEADLSALDEETSLRDAFEIIRSSVEPPLPLVVMWNDLYRYLNVEPDMPIGFDIRGMISLRLALELVVSSVSLDGQRPVILREGGLLLAVSPQFALTKMRTRVYDIGELTSFGVWEENSRYAEGYSGRFGK
ncbi:MAG: hypothetical protein KA469_01145 [Phycisphaerae bacterium]|jgi:hypothetical protein|nr:hypothetical protein [Phycisphaerae bacterium]